MPPVALLLSWAISVSLVGDEQLPALVDLMLWEVLAAWGADGDCSDLVGEARHAG